MRILHEMFGLKKEATPIGQANREINGAQSLVRRPSGPRKPGGAHDKVQGELDSAQSVKREDAGGGSGLRVSGDKASMGALVDALHEASAAVQDNPDLADWCEAAYKAVAQGMRSAQGTISVTLPPFEETPDVDSFNDDPGLPGGEED